ncbi:Putative protein [Zobellia galactanivorans]|uniref:Uncharacterized protein n=1 Tax=Zobellia galactanivorans (strain DSM 12802 / CCUG 47099 / CIP 106680 / NCIMB 13871 / Dsij) TaxID=63186 RepID=G0L197_ZOBGA|nr:Putative protein [Zobellia galactanivorans]
MEYLHAFRALLDHFHHLQTKKQKAKALISKL